MIETVIALDEIQIIDHKRETGDFSAEREKVKLELQEGVSLTTNQVILTIITQSFNTLQKISIGTETVFTVSPLVFQADKMSNEMIALKVAIWTEALAHHRALSRFLYTRFKDKVDILPYLHPDEIKRKITHLSDSANHWN